MYAYVSQSEAEDEVRILLDNRICVNIVYVDFFLFFIVLTKVLCKSGGK